MKVTQMTVAGVGGKATVFRSETGEVVINVSRATGSPREDSWTVDARDGEAQARAAVAVQRLMDGYAGTNSEVGDYLRAIQTFAD
jgi:hypothetical protein